jgi:hypothetical protein
MKRGFLACALAAILFACSGSYPIARAVMFSSPLLWTGPYPQASEHYATTGNWTTGSAQPLADLGFNLIDVSSAGDMPYLPAGTKALVFLGLCNGTDSTFTSTVGAYSSYASSIFGFYILDEPDPTGLFGTQCLPSNVKAESDYLHTNFPGTKTFVVLMNLGTQTAPSYVYPGAASFNGSIAGSVLTVSGTITGTLGANYPEVLSGTGVAANTLISACSGSPITSCTVSPSQTVASTGSPEAMSASYPFYTAADSDIDYFGIDPYPCQGQFNGCLYSQIGSYLNAAESAPIGLTLSNIVPVFQAFGGGGYSQWTLPTEDQEEQILAIWAGLDPTPPWTYVYAWGVQLSDQALSTTPYLQAIFKYMNTH